MSDISAPQAPNTLPGFDSQQAMGRTGVTLRQLNHWDREGIVSPSIQPADGSGSRRRYSEKDLFHLATARTLRKAGLPLDSVKKVLATIRAGNLDVTSSSDTFLVGTDSDVLYLGSDKHQLVDAASRTPMTFVVNLAKIAADQKKQARLAAAQSLAVVADTLKIGNQAFQILITKAASGFEAKCNAHADCLSKGKSVEEAVAALRAKIEEKQAGPPRFQKTASDQRSSKQQKPTKPEPTQKASSWGDDW